MNLMTIVGIVLAGLGIIGLVYGGITYTTSKSVVDVGSVHLKVDDTDRIPIPPIAGGAALAGGAVLILLGRRRPMRG
jgi:hypothetical protein